MERDLTEFGFVVVPGPVRPDDIARLVDAYDAAVASAEPGDVRIGSTTTRVSDFVNRDSIFDGLYIHEPALDACRHVIGRPFRLSTMHARTVRPHMPPQNLHVDFARTDEGWPMVGFIFMVDDFRRDNGATLFVPGSHVTNTPDDVAPVTACGPAGSMILFNGSVWHGHGANTTDRPRRSIQGAYIRREEKSSVIELAARMRSDTIARIGPLAKYVLGV